MRQLITVTVIGGDKTGVIARITSLLFELGANIEAMEEQVTRGQFSMVLQASWKASQWRPGVIQSALEKVGAELGMEIKLRTSQPHALRRVGLLVTREPHCLEALLRGFENGTLKAKPVVVVGNRSELKPLAKAAGIPFCYLPWDDRVKGETAALKVLEEYEVDFVVLARFMKILSPNFVWRYKNKIINIHPSLLPSFPGPQPYRQAYERGVKMAGVTAHFVTMHLDEGPIIAQAAFPVLPNMTLPKIVAAGQKLESKVLVKAVRLFLQKRLDVHWGVVREV